VYVVERDADGNPIFGTFGADTNILGYDLLGNPIYKGSVTINGRTDSGLPIYNYSTINTAKSNGISQQNALKNGKDGLNGTDGSNGNGADGTNGADGAAGANGTGKDGDGGERQ